MADGAERAHVTDVTTNEHMDASLATGLVAVAEGFPGGQSQLADALARLVGEGITDTDLSETREVLDVPKMTADVRFDIGMRLREMFSDRGAAVEYSGPATVAERTAENGNGENQ